MTNIGLLNMLNVNELVYTFFVWINHRVHFMGRQFNFGFCQFVTAVPSPLKMEDVKAIFFTSMKLYNSNKSTPSFDRSSHSPCGRKPQESWSKVTEYS